MNKVTEMCIETLIKRNEALEKRVTALEGQAQEQPGRRFIPEDSNGARPNEMKRCAPGSNCSEPQACCTDKGGSVPSGTLD
jgi:hypothetical protein